MLNKFNKIFKTGMVALTYNFGTGIVEAGGSGIHGLSQLYCEFVANLGYPRPHIKKQKHLFKMS